jgi:hypothetical protein
MVAEFGELAVDGESAWGAVAGFPRLRFPRPLSEPDVRFSPHPALHRTHAASDGGRDRLPPNGAVWSASPVPAHAVPGHSPRHLRALQFPPSKVLLPPFAMWPAFPSSDYYGGSAPSRPDRPTVGPAR